MRRPGSGTNRRLVGIAAGAGALGAALAVGWAVTAATPSIPVVNVAVPPSTEAPLCPWREPEADTRAFFPGATRYVTETRVVSGEFVELSRRLGRMPTGEDLALHLYPVFAGERRVGTVVVRRVKGEYGAIEVVAGAGEDGKVRGVRLQRLREPPEIAGALESPAWLGAMKGKGADDPWRMGEDLPPVPASARRSAEAVAGGVHALLVILSVARKSGLVTDHGHHH